MFVLLFIQSNPANMDTEGARESVHMRRSCYINQKDTFTTKFYKNKGFPQGQEKLSVITSVRIYKQVFVKRGSTVQQSLLATFHFPVA